MARKKSETPKPTGSVEQTAATETVEKAEVKGTACEEIQENILKIMRLYPQYEKLYISKEGFVFTENTPESMRGDAVLYVNKYYKQ